VRSRRLYLFAVVAVAALLGLGVLSAASGDGLATWRARRLCSRVEPVDHGRLVAAFPSRAGALARWDLGAWQTYQARDFSGHQQPASSPWLHASKDSFVAVCYTRAVVLGPPTGLNRVDVSGNGPPVQRVRLTRWRVHPGGNPAGCRPRTAAESGRPQGRP
jgi:hypothetical protein